KPSNHGITSDPCELVDSCHSANDGVIFNNDMSCQINGISHNDPITNFTIMCNMAVRHDQTIISKANNGIFLARRVDRYVFADFTVFPNDNKCLFTTKFKILSLCTDTSPRPNSCASTNGSIAVYVSMGLDGYIVF